MTADVQYCYYFLSHSKIMFNCLYNVNEHYNYNIFHMDFIMAIPWETHIVLYSVPLPQFAMKYSNFKYNFFSKFP